MSLARGRLGMELAAGVHAQGAALGRPGTDSRDVPSCWLEPGPLGPPLSHPALWALAVTSLLEQRRESLYFLVLNRNLDT